MADDDLQDLTNARRVLTDMRWQPPRAGSATDHERELAWRIRFS
jgi:hypothetical protein